MHRLTVFRDKDILEDKTDSMLRNMKKKMDEDLKKFGFGKTRTGLLSGWSDDEDDDDDVNSLMSRDFFKSNSSRTGAAKVKSNKNSRQSKEEAEEGEMNFSATFDLTGFEPEHISLDVDEDHNLILQARRRLDSNGAISTKEFNRKVKLPSHVDPTKLTSSLGQDGILVVQAPAVFHSHVEMTTAAAAANMPQLTIVASPIRTDASGSVKISSSGTSGSSPTELDNPVFRTDPATGLNKLQLVLDLGLKFHPDDVTVKLEGKALTVRAAREEKLAQSSGTGAASHASKSCVERSFNLAERVDPESLEAFLRPDGRLAITAFVERPPTKCKVIAQ